MLTLLTWKPGYQPVELCYMLKLQFVNPVSVKLGIKVSIMHKRKKNLHHVDLEKGAIAALQRVGGILQTASSLKLETSTVELFRAFETSGPQIHVVLRHTCKCLCYIYIYMYVYILYMQCLLRRLCLYYLLSNYTEMKYYEYTLYHFKIGAVDKILKCILCPTSCSLTVLSFLNDLIFPLQTISNIFTLFKEAQCHFHLCLIYSERFFFFQLLFDNFHTSSVSLHFPTWFTLCASFYSLNVVKPFSKLKQNVK